MPPRKTPEIEPPAAPPLGYRAVEALEQRVKDAEAAIQTACSQLENLERGAALATLKAYLKPKGLVGGAQRIIGDEAG